jgi:hypothetical protein
MCRKYFEILEVNEDVSIEDLKSAYRRKQLNITQIRIAKKLLMKILFSSKKLSVDC